MLAIAPQRCSPQLTARIYDEFVIGGPNAHQYWYRARNHLNGSIFGPLRIMFNYVVLEVCKHLPSLSLKRWVLGQLGMKLGHNVTIASGVTLDYFFPELIEIGDNTIVGMNTMILTHEFLPDRFRKGRVRIGCGCMIGAQSTLLAGVDISEFTTVCAMSLVHKGTPIKAFVAGVPIQIIKPKTCS